MTIVIAKAVNLAASMYFCNNPFQFVEYSAFLPYNVKHNSSQP
jgi:hypothetical protein